MVQGVAWVPPVARKRAYVAYTRTVKKHGDTKAMSILIDNGLKNPPSSWEGANWRAKKNALACLQAPRA